MRGTTPLLTSSIDIMPEADDLVRRVLRHLYATPEAFLHGRRQGDTAFSLVDNAAATAAPEWLDIVPRSTVHSMLDQGYLEGGGDDNIVVYRLSDSGRVRLEKELSSPE